jgi:thiosulfate/3-mercaptopyruvate sulfurtransferase
MAGHIPGAYSLPVIWVWEPDGTYRPADLIAGMATGAIGDDRGREVITYCGVGGYASTWWYLLTQVLGYTDVKIYDGSMEAWVDEGNPLAQFNWTR